MNSTGYLNVLSNAMLPSAWSFRGLDFTFQHDNAPCHKAAAVTEWLAEQNVSVLNWPPQSPDLNPIEHLWEYIQCRLNMLPTTTTSTLWENIRRIWNSIPPDVVTKLVESMPSRLRTVIKAKGGHTKY